MKNNLTANLNTFVDGGLLIQSIQLKVNHTGTGRAKIKCVVKFDAAFITHVDHDHYFHKKNCEW